MQLLNNEYRIESTCGSIVAVSSSSILYRKRNYYIINPFTKTCTFVGSLGLGDWGFFTLLKNCQQQKYHWVVLKHVYTEFQTKYFISSSIHMGWRQTCPIDGDVLWPKNPILYNQTMLWVDSHVVSRDNHICIYKLCWIDLHDNKWGFQFIPHSNSTLSISLACYRNEILCFINDGRNTMWSIEPTKNQYDSTNSSIRFGCLEGVL